MDGGFPKYYLIIYRSYAQSSLVVFAVSVNIPDL